MTVCLFVQLTVKDFDTWKKHFDGAAEFMQNMGVVANTVHRNLDDPNSIMIAQQVSESSLKEYLALLEGSQDRRAEEGILSWEQWVGNIVE
jgi:hypothetical protein